MSPRDFRPALTYRVGNLFFHLLLHKQQHLTVSLTDENASAVGMGQGLPLPLPSLMYFCLLACHAFGCVIVLTTSQSVLLYWVCTYMTVGLQNQVGCIGNNVGQILHG